jgi:hypothetical protein
MSSFLSHTFAEQYGLMQEKSACLNLCSARSAPSRKELWNSRTRQAAVETRLSSLRILFEKMS